MSTESDFIRDVIDRVRKVKEKSEQPTRLHINPALLTPERLPWFMAECDRLGINLELSQSEIDSGFD